MPTLTEFEVLTTQFKAKVDKLKFCKNETKGDDPPSIFTSKMRDSSVTNSLVKPNRE